MLFKFEKLWIEVIVESIIGHPFLTNFRVDMTSFVNFHMMIFKRSAFKAFASAQNEVESKGGHKVTSYNMLIFTSGRGGVYL